MSYQSEPLQVNSWNAPLFLVFLEFLLLTACIVDLAAALLFRSEPNILIYSVTAFVILFATILLVRSFSKTQVRVKKQAENQQKSQLYTALLDNSEQNASISLIRSRAIQYSQDLIDDYKDTRRSARNVYYLFQIATVVLSGVTPILVVLDKTDVNIPWLRWLPVIFPAVASIATSISTSFPFQKTWVNANTAVELLEAEQEKFILGVSPSYRFYDAPDSAQRKQKVQESIENFITQVNTIHLKQFQGSNAAETRTQETEANNSNAQTGESSKTPQK